LQKPGFFGLIGSRRTLLEKEQNKASVRCSDCGADEAGRTFSMATDGSQTFVRRANLMILRRCLNAYLFLVKRIWNHLPTFLRSLSLGRVYGRHLHGLVRLLAERKQYFATFFLRNRAELELMHRLLEQKAHGSNLDVSVLACSKGAEVYSVAWTIRSARPDLTLRMHAVDISQEILEFAEKGVYSLSSGLDVTKGANDEGTTTNRRDIAWNTARDQNAPMFERMTDKEVEAMFEIEGDQARVRPWLKEGVIWLRGDAADPELVRLLGPQDMVVANRFLCHMEPAAAERCLRNVARLVEPSGHLFVSGIDLDVRMSLAQEMGWKPVADLIKEIHEGDPSLRQGWPLEYWGLEPFWDDRSDWKFRYASVFQIGESPQRMSQDCAHSAL
jgi:chemotaxis methyl-accepting protein methylase